MAIRLRYSPVEGTETVVERTEWAGDQKFHLRRVLQLATGRAQVTVTQVASPANPTCSILITLMAGLQSPELGKALRSIYPRPDCCKGAG